MLQMFKQYVQSHYGHLISHIHKDEEKPPLLVDFPTDLSPEIQKILQKKGIEKLYSHQAQAFQYVKEKNNTLIVSHTASGKTLSFLLPILDDYVKNPHFTTLFLYPTKALARDQEQGLRQILNLLKKETVLGTFDGDTPPEERQRLASCGDFILSNPDMLHSGILPNHQRRWQNFLSRLKYVVIDEVHTFRGAYGSHVANLLARFTRIARLYDNEPIFICSSATIGNPKEHVEALCQKPFQIVNKDGSRRPKRTFYFMNPPIFRDDKGAAYRKGSSTISIPLIREAVRLNLRSISFVRARQEGERLYQYVTEGHSFLRDKVKPYRGGLLPSERRALERDLFSGKLNAVISTNALELGIDIGDLDICILSGHPGSIASFWQQAGRVGRQGKEAVIIFIAKNTSINQYMVHHPDFILGSPIEQAWLSAQNPYIFLQHLPCAAYEHPLREKEQGFPEPDYQDAVKLLLDKKTLRSFSNSYVYNLSDYPARGVNIRGMSDHNIQIISNGKVIGELDPIGARGTLYKDAIYQHLGRRYLSLDLNLEQKTCKVTPIDADYYTEAVWQSTVKHTEVITTETLHANLLHFGVVNVNKQPKVYKKIKEKTLDNIGYGPITLAPFIYDTMGLSLIPGEAWVHFIFKIDKRLISTAFYGLSYILKNTVPSLTMGDIKDVDTDVSLSIKDQTNWKISLFLYDTHEGGVGYAEKAFEKFKEILSFIKEIISECECQAGCPACIPPIPPGIDDDTLEEWLSENNVTVEATKSLIQFLLDGSLVAPEIVYSTLDKKPMDIEVDLAAMQRRQKLNRAYDMLIEKMNRQH